MITAKLELPPEVEDLLEGLSDGDLEDALRDAAEGFCGPGGVLEQHWIKGQSRWGESDLKYRDRKQKNGQGSEKFVKTGAAKEALTGPSPYRKITVSKQGGKQIIQVALVRMEGGRNIYSIAQAGGKNASGPPMRITQALPGDEAIVAPYVAASVKRIFKQKGA